jgi:hypothetical protein
MLPSLAQINALEILGSFPGDTAESPGKSTRKGQLSYVKRGTINPRALIIAEIRVNDGKNLFMSHASH